MCLIMQNKRNERLVEMATIGERIKALRKAADMTQDEFGSKFGIVKSTVSLYENGRSTPNDEIKKRICEYFSVSMDYLLGIDSSPAYVPSAGNTTAKCIFDLGNHENFNALVSKKGSSIKKLSQETGIAEKSLITIFDSYIPSITESVALADSLDVSLDELLGRPNKTTLTDDEQDVLLYYRQLRKMDKQWVMGKMLDILKKYDESVAADPSEAPSVKMAK